MLCPMGGVGWGDRGGAEPPEVCGDPRVKCSPGGMGDSTEEGRGGEEEEGAAAEGFTFPPPARALAAEQELTEVGELHSLTDWQVSEASEDAELEDFCCARRPSREPEGERRGG